MKIAFLGDLHIGNHRQYGGAYAVGMNERCRAVIGAVERALQWAHEQGCTDVVVLGDVFDTPRPLPQQLAALRSVLLSSSAAVHLLVGNHDRVSATPGDHGLEPLNFEDLGDRVVVYDKPMVIGDATCAVLLCPFDDRPVMEWLPQALELGAGGEQWDGARERIVCGHFGLWDRQQAAGAPWLAAARDAVDVDAVARLLSQHDVRHLYVGNYHQYFRWTLHGRFLHQLGALVPTGYDNPGWAYGRVEIWPDDAREPQVIPGPRFVVVSSVAELTDAVGKAHAQGCMLYADWRCTPDGLGPAIEAAAALEVDAARAAVGLSVEVHVDRKFCAARAADAAGSARSGTTLLEAVHGFVAKYPLPAHVSRDAVLAHVKGFLGC